jgi:hypothetical protein
MLKAPPPGDEVTGTFKVIKAVDSKMHVDEKLFDEIAHAKKFGQQSSEVK